MLSILLRNRQEMNSDEFLKSGAEEFKKRSDAVKRKLINLCLKQRRTD